MKFVLEIELGNEAMLNACDVADALMRTAPMVESAVTMLGGEAGRIFDQNGNRVGNWAVTE